VVSGRPASPAGPSPQGTQFGNGSGPLNQRKLRRWGVLQIVKSGRQARRRMKAQTSVSAGCFCERVSELGSKYTTAHSVEHRRVARKSKGQSEGTSDKTPWISQQRETLEAER